MADRPRQSGIIAWLVAFVVPPVVAVGLWRQFVAQHAVWAVAIGVTYGAIIAVAGFSAVVAANILSRWQVNLADRILLFVQGGAERFERRYRRFVHDGLRFMDNKGLATVGPFAPELDAVFVDVHLVARPPQQIGTGILSEIADERAGFHGLDYFLGRKMPAFLALVGGPGSGKSTLLRHAALQACLRKPSRNRRSIPILLYLRDHASAIIADPTVSVADLLRRTLGQVDAEEPSRWFEQQLRDGRCLVLLDGLDEVTRQEDRAKVSAWTEGQVRQYPSNDFVISSRPLGYRLRRWRVLTS